ncbi:prepilin-type N-terminal cleavage/methylation domain-containing protein [Paucibacter sp. APW11]|uniref:Prepilin-type N-terminal cleavage/methylation domain-containing protein n=1 Tax=Roseateles aquae TaxID=3077235 RepID=A0ABU3PF93_9BURK|nr:prepilin-type N-terminal cleavage/methylation domain-containing protein [Paucibacter sp. APW11]MDT9001249.1 prepilin-type N-terminal cleavage/methylation domain-containing protein [Paucibacter sp. APW11]
MHGFSLMELLVVMVIVGLLSSILLQALSQVYRLEERFTTQLQGGQRGVMQEDWLRQVLQSLVPASATSSERLQGSDSRLQAVTLAPLTRAPGAATAVTLELASSGRGGNLVLGYKDDAGTFALMDAGREASFVYVDEAGMEHGQWPPLSGAHPPLPSAVMLRSVRPEGVQLQVVVPRITLPPQVLMPLDLAGKQ